MQLRVAIDRGFSMNALHRQMGYSRQAYHQQSERDRRKKEKTEKAKEQAKATRKIHPQLGSRRMHKTARIEGLGITRFEEMMSSEGLTVSKKRKWIKTTDSSGYKHIYPNLTNGLKVMGINELVVGDMTYFMNSSGLFYLFLLTDVYSLRIVGWEASQEKRSCYAQSAFEKMVDLRGEANMIGTIQHTDRGGEYRSDPYIERLLSLGMKISMAKTCLENGYAERTNGLVKGSYLEFMECSNLKQVRACLTEAVLRLNHLHKMVLENHSPVEYEEWTKGLPLHERPIVEMYDFAKSATNHKANQESQQLVDPNHLPPSCSQPIDLAALSWQSRADSRKKPHRYRANSNLF